MPTQPDMFQRDWAERMEPLVLEKLRGKTFTADDIHPIVEPPAHPNAYGALMRRVKKHCELVGHQRSTRPERQGGLLRVWRVK